MSPVGIRGRFGRTDLSRMPLPTPAGALPRAHRVACVRCVRQMKKNADHICEFGAAALKKCSYCITQKAACVPVSPSYFSESEQFRCIFGVDSDGVQDPLVLRSGV